MKSDRLSLDLNLGKRQNGTSRGRTSETGGRAEGGKNQHVLQLRQHFATGLAARKYPVVLDAAIGADVGLHDQGFGMYRIHRQLEGRGLQLRWSVESRGDIIGVDKLARHQEARSEERRVAKE